MAEEFEAKTVLGLQSTGESDVSFREHCISVLSVGAAAGVRLSAEHCISVLSVGAAAASIRLSAEHCISVLSVAAVAGVRQSAEARMSAEHCISVLSVAFTEDGKTNAG